MRTFGDWLTATGRVPGGVDLPAGCGIGGALTAVGRQVGPGRDDALELWRSLFALYDRYVDETGAARVTVVRAAPIADSDRRALAGLLGGVL